MLIHVLGVEGERFCICCVLILGLSNLQFSLVNINKENICFLHSLGWLYINPPWEKATSPKYRCSMKYLNSESVDFTFISIFVCFTLCGRTFSHYSNKGIRIQPQGIFYLLLNMVSGFSLQFFHIVLQGFLDTLLHAGDLLLSCYE